MTVNDAIAYAPTAASISRDSKAEQTNAASRYWDAMRETGPSRFAHNLHLRVGTVAIDAGRSPLAVHADDSDAEPNAYSASLRTQYLRYTRSELGRLATPGLRVPARGALIVARALLHAADVDRTVQWNGWLYSTNPWPESTLAVARDITTLLRDRFPQHALLLRNVDDSTEYGATSALARLGYLLIASRQVYHFDGRTAHYRSRETTRRDRKLLCLRDGYTLCEHSDFSTADMSRVATLYRLVYLEKHSYLNVDYRTEFFTRAWRERWLEFVGLRNASGQVDAVLGCLRLAGRVSTPFLGYDTTVAPVHALYRRLVALLLERTAERQERLNFSSGADEFKRRRGGAPSIEYNAVYVAHLPRWRRRAWEMIARASERLSGRVFAKLRGP